MIKITPKHLSIPPYLSTTWSEIISLSWNEPRNVLTAILRHRGPVEIPDLGRAHIDAIFEAHSRFSEEEGTPVTVQKAIPFNFSIPFNNNKRVSCNTIFLHKNSRGLV